MSNRLWDQQQKVYYDGYQLPVATVSWTAKAEYDSTGNILQGYLLTFKLGLVVTESSINNLSNRIANLLAILARPRRDFWWQFNGENFFRVNPATEGSGKGVEGSTQSSFQHFYYDRRYGPKPRVSNIEKHSGGKTARITADIECFVNTCPGNIVSDFEEARFEFSYSFDMNFSCTRTINGVYRLRSPLNAGMLLPNGGYFPSLPQTFRRERWDHKLSPDGLTLSFTTVDKQRWRTLPRPLTDGQAIFTIGQVGGKMVKTLNASFEAPNSVNKRVILQFIMTLIATKFPTLFTGAAILKEFKIQNDEFNNKVSVNVSTTETAVTLIKPAGWSQATGTYYDNKEKLLGGLTKNGWFDIKDLTPDPQDEWQQIDGWSQVSPMTGTAGLVPIPLQPWQMCQEGASVPTDAWAPNATAIAPVGLAGGTGEGSPGSPTGSGDGDPGEKDTIFTTDHQEAPYETYSEVILYRLNTGVVVIPTSGGKAAVTQQIHAPYVTIIQSGSASRYRKMVDIPSPAFVGNRYGEHDTNSRLIKKDVTVSAPEFIGDGTTPFHKATWCYTIEVPDASLLNDPPQSESADVNVDILVPPNIIIDYNNTSVKENLDYYAGKVKSNGDSDSDGSYYPTPYPIP